jgi:hypothetical protein
MTSARLLFLASVIAGAVLWVVFDLMDTEPWDSAYGWVAVAVLGFAFGFVGRERPMLWPAGIFVGQALFGTASFLNSLFLYTGGGLNFFVPLGLMFLVPFTIPAFLGAFLGSSLRQALDKPPDRGAKGP